VPRRARVDPPGLVEAKFTSHNKIVLSPRGYKWWRLSSRVAARVTATPSVGVKTNA